MSDFYLGNGSKRPKLEDYKKKFGLNAQRIYRLDKIRYEQNQQSLKQAKERNKQASKHAETLDHGLFSNNSSKGKTVKKGGKKK